MAFCAWVIVKMEPRSTGKSKIHGAPTGERQVTSASRGVETRTAKPISLSARVGRVNSSPMSATNIADAVGQILRRIVFRPRQWWFKMHLLNCSRKGMCRIKTL